MRFVRDLSKGPGGKGLCLRGRSEKRPTVRVLSRIRAKIGLDKHPSSSWFMVAVMERAPRLSGRKVVEAYPIVRNRGGMRCGWRVVNFADTQSEFPPNECEVRETSRRRLNFRRLCARNHSRRPGHTSERFERKNRYDPIRADGLFVRFFFVLDRQNIIPRIPKETLGSLFVNVPLDCTGDIILPLRSKFVCLHV